MIKKIIIIIIILSNIFLLSGCWDSVEIDKMDIVAGVAIDKGTNGEKYNMVVELVNLSGNENGDVSSVTVESSGNTVFDTIRNMISITSQKLYWGHCKIIIIGEEIAKDGIIPILDMFLRDNDLRLTIDVLISKNVEAKEILLVKSESSNINSYDINTMLDNSTKSLSKSKKSQLFEAINHLSSDGISCTLPAVTVDEANDTSLFKLDGIAVFNKDKLVGFLNSEESKYFLFIVNEIKVPVLSIRINNTDNSYVCCEIFDNKTTIKQSYENDELLINIHTKTIVGIDDIESYTNPANISNYHELETLLEKQLEYNIQSLIIKVQKDYGSDIFGFGQIIHEQNPKIWKNYKPTWNITFKNLKTNIKSEFIIRDTGTAKDTIKNGA